MWFPKSIFDKFNSVLRLGALKEADQILVGVLEDEKNNAAAPGSCPHCKKHLVHQALPYLEVFVNACPEKHGFWMTPENSLGLKKFIHEQLIEKSHKKKRLPLVKSFLAGFTVILILHLAAPLLKNVETLHQNRLNQLENEKISAAWWPMKTAASFRALPEASSIEAVEERVYLEDWAGLMAENISNRLNMAGVLQTARPPEEYQELLSLYLRRQNFVLEKMALLPMPEKFGAFHAHTLMALQAQMRFYTALAIEKSRDASFNLEMLLKHPDLAALERELDAAYQNILKIYPDLDEKTDAAIQQRLNLTAII